MKTCLRTMAISLGGLCLVSTVQAQGSLKGVWEVRERTQIEGGESTTISDPQPSLYLFTDRYYAIMFIPGTEPRPDLMVVQQQLRQASGEDLVAAFNTFVANAGTYRSLRLKADEEYRCCQNSRRNGGDGGLGVRGQGRHAHDYRDERSRRYHAHDTDPAGVSR